MPYDHRSAEPKWQARWKDASLHRTSYDPAKPKFYALDMFPYPSGAGLHVGHCEGYTATDIITRYKRMQGWNVLHPMGWDAFGLPAENYAIKTGVHPRLTTEQAIANFRRQIDSVGFAYDWEREVNTTDPNYYKWTQWIFLRLYEKGLAYEGTVAINWCPSCKTGLANEEVTQGRCERCGTQVVRKDMRQWLLRITRYADRLLEDLAEVDWPESTLAMQRNWIGRSEGAEVAFPLAAGGGEIRVFTTRPDTLFGATYMVLAPEHPLVARLTTPDQAGAVAEYQTRARLKSDLERTDLSRDKTGVFTGGFAVNPVNGEEVPVWIADYVLSSYGTGAIMAVPAHDERDHAFALKFDLPIRPVVRPKDGRTPAAGQAFTEEGVAINSGSLDGLATRRGQEGHHRRARGQGPGQGRRQLQAARLGLLPAALLGRAHPHRPLCKVRRPGARARRPAPGHPARRRALPAPTGTGESPLAAIEAWVTTTCPHVRRPRPPRDKHHAPVGRVVLVLPALPRSPQRRASSVQGGGEAVDAGRPVRGRRRTCRPAPAVRPLLAQGALRPGPRHHQGAVQEAAPPGHGAGLHLHRTPPGRYHEFSEVEFRGEQRAPARHRREAEASPSRRWPSRCSTASTPTTWSAEYGADVLRLYEMFMGDFELPKPWDPRAIEGCNRFLKRIWRLVEEFDPTRAGRRRRFTCACATRPSRR